MATVLVVGATGAVGSKVVEELLAIGKPVRALVRPGSDATALEQRGVAVARGDMLDPVSLATAFRGIDCVITSAAGYTRRRKTDNADTDVAGNRNLAVAAQQAGVRRFVLCSILNCHQTPDIPHFWHKKLAEDGLDELNVPYVSLRPGAFLDQSVDIFAKFVKSRRVMALGDAQVTSTFVYTRDLARCLALSVDAPVKPGEKIDIGWDRPISMEDLRAIISRSIGERVALRTIPRWLMEAVLAPLSWGVPMAKDIRAMFRYIWSGRYVADTRRQAEVFGAVPSAEDAIGRWLVAVRTDGPAPSKN
jgi:uncharacterized protein YbjT (DUF2867 family)